MTLLYTHTHSCLSGLLRSLLISCPPALFPGFLGATCLANYLLSCNELPRAKHTHSSTHSYCIHMNYFLNPHINANTNSVFLTHSDWGAHTHTHTLRFRARNRTTLILQWSGLMKRVELMQGSWAPQTDIEWTYRAEEMYREWQRDRDELRVILAERETSAVYKQNRWNGTMPRSPEKLTLLTSPRHIYIWIYF